MPTPSPPMSMSFLNILSPRTCSGLQPRLAQLDEALTSIKSEPRNVIPLLNGIDHVAVLRSRWARVNSFPQPLRLKPTASAGTFPAKHCGAAEHCDKRRDLARRHCRRIAPTSAFCARLLTARQTCCGANCIPGPIRAGYLCVGKVQQIQADPAWKTASNSLHR